MILYRIGGEIVESVLSTDTDEKDVGRLMLDDYKLRTPNFVSYYTRVNMFPDGSKLYDYGSHFYFYFLTNRKLNIGDNIFL